MVKEEHREYECHMVTGEVLEPELLSGEVIACPVCSGKVEQSSSDDCQKNTLKEELIMDKEENREYECNLVTGEVIESELLSGEVIACPVCSREIKLPICDDCLKNNKERRIKNIQDKYAKKEEQKNCEREGIFWLPKCSICGSANISVAFKPEFENTCDEGEESIHNRCEFKYIEIQCHDCYCWQKTKYSPSIFFISEALNIPVTTKITTMDYKIFEVFGPNFHIVRIE